MEQDLADEFPDEAFLMRHNATSVPDEMPDDPAELEDRTAMAINNTLLQDHSSIQFGDQSNLNNFSMINPAHQASWQQQPVEEQANSVATPMVDFTQFQQPNLEADRPQPAFTAAGNQIDLTPQPNEPRS